MTEPDDTRPAIAWNMRRPEQISASGRKTKSTYFCVMVVDNYVMTGTGRRGSMKYKVIKFASPQNARLAAVAITSQQERKDYVLHGPVKTLHTAPGQREWLDTQIASEAEEANEALDGAFKSIFNHGVLVA